MNSDGYPIGSTFPDGLTTDAIVSLDDTASIELGDNEINLIAANVLVNGLPISGGGGGVTNPLSTDLDANEYSITNAGAVNAAVFVKAGGTGEQYLMADGSSLKYSANSGNSNFYLYDNGTDQNPTPASGIITYNAGEQKPATEIYISHRTRDNIDIEVFFNNISSLNDVYIQDQSNSENNIRYNITDTPIIVNQAQITIPVKWVSSSGNGSISFGNGHNILLSFFTNSIETDLRLTELESKTQNINASLIGNDFTNNSSFILDPSASQSFTIRNNNSPFSTPKFVVSDTAVQVISVPLLMNNQKITFLGTPVNVGDATRKDYVDNLITPLQTKTQNISGAALITTILRNTQFKLTGADTFSVRDDATIPNNKFVVENTGVSIRVPMTMNTFALSGIPNPINPDDAANKSYVDQQITAAPSILRQAISITSVTTNGLLETIMNPTATFGSFSWADTAIGQTRRWILSGAQTRGTFSASYTIKFKTNANTNITWILPASPSVAVNNKFFQIELIQTRKTTVDMFYFARFISPDATTEGYNLYTSQNAGGSVVGLGTLAPYTITIQSSLASANLTVHHIAVDSYV